MWPFKRKARTALELLQGASWRCKNCDEPHDGMFDIGEFAPDCWDGPREYRPNAFLKHDQDFLSEDFCVVDGEHFLVRCVISIPVHGMSESFGYGCWGSLHKDNFKAYVDHFDHGFPENTDPWWSWLNNNPRPFVGEENVGCWMYPRPHRLRPLLRIDDADHPLAVAQARGISAETVLDIYRAYGHAVA